MSKYAKGELITSLDEFANQNMIYDARTNKVYSYGWCQSWQFRYIKIGICSKWFYKVKEQSNG